MIYRYGNMLDKLNRAEVYLVTTNSYIRKDGALVMGRGAAKQLAGMFPGLPYELGKRIEHLGEYNIGVLTQTNFPNLSLGAFQVKFNFSDQADLGLIKRSCEELARIAKDSRRTFNVNFPGIGNGRLDISLVEPLLEQLPDNVQVWRFKEEGYGRVLEEVSDEEGA